MGHGTPLRLATAVLGLALMAQAAPVVFISPFGEPFRPGARGPIPSMLGFPARRCNHDGRIDRAEFRADAEAFFKKLDTNGDGVIDGFEIAAYERDHRPRTRRAGRSARRLDLA